MTDKACKNRTRLALSHPCFALGRPVNKGRVHLPVSPTCNIFCKFCSRSIGGSENLPGVSWGVISPKEAVSVVREATRLSGNIAVAGIAGPGDPLASRHALETFALLKKEFPRLIKCMSTNGLLLPQYAEEIIEACVSSLTVTVNDIYSETLVKINDKIVYDGELISGERSAKILIENQLEGIKILSRHGVVIKVNTVLMSGVNDDHIAEIARRVKEAGASIYNIIPLIPQNEFAGERPPSCDAINRARIEAQKHIDVFRHCKHCRADAIGIPGGKDYAERIYGKGIAKETFSHG